MSDSYTTIIGLEVHVQLATESKLFCRCRVKFGAPPNTQTCPVCLGLPGSLPVMNSKAYELSLRTAVALNCQIPEFTKWDRKQYYYPDLPKGYQVSQYDLPMSQDGYVSIADSKDRFEPTRVRIIRAHLEEDAGKSIHDEIAGRADSQIDLNRTGTPLLEIVSEPDMRSPSEARAFLDELKLLLTYIGVSDCNMQEGSLRVDANINLHISDGGITGDGGEESEPTATPIVEIKNMNSFRAVERALAHEEQRQFQHWEETGERLGQVPKQTRGWDDAAGVTTAQRSKEESSDYRYLPDPDLVPVVVSDAQLAAARDSLGELPAALRERLQRDYSLSPYDADVLVNHGRPVAEYYLAVADESGDSKSAANWVIKDVVRVMKEKKFSIDQFRLRIPESDLAEIIRKVSSGDWPISWAREVFDEMAKTIPKSVANKFSPVQTLKTLGKERVDERELTSLCEGLISANPKIVADVKNGNPKAIGALIGQAKKKNPNVDPTKVREICLQLIGGT